MSAFNCILVANRGEIACRILRTVRDLGYRSVAVYSAADGDSRHLQLADESLCIGPAQVNQSYLNIPAIIDAAKRTGADAIHPGYGFLSENAEFAEACAQANICFIGPSVNAIRLMGSKRLSKIAMLAAGVPCIPGYEGAAQDDDTLSSQAQAIGYPVMIKASAGGGGRGMRLVSEPSELLPQLRSARSEALAAFGSDELILEKALLRPRHVEVQVFGDQQGNLVHLGERDCSVQRRHQKVIEEAPCPVMTTELRQRMCEAALKAAASVDYCGAGTVEFMLDERGSFYFLEMNTRLQVEHPVTEMLTGVDLVAWQIRVAQGQTLPLQQAQIALQGHAIEVRLYAEDATRGFLPQTGQIRCWQPADLPGVRIDHGLQQGQTISPFYDPLLAKLIAHGNCREAARLKLIRALEQSVLLGVVANQRFLINLLHSTAFTSGEATTALVTELFAADPSLLPQRPSSNELAIAAALLYQHSAQRFTMAGWSNSASLPSRYLLEHAGEVYAVYISQKAPATPGLLQACVDDQRLELKLPDLDQPQCWIELEAVRYPLAYRVDGDQLWLKGDNGSLALRNVSQRPANTAQSSDSGNLYAPMDGAIVSILASEGEQVCRGQLLMVMEAMKMEHQLKAGCDGVIASVAVSAGQQVRHRQRLVEISP
ncbi:acetyl/propionyl/methylcrotonyl-CoA carboxylase subunit alpha [Halopseudomonas pelagia]|uniref:acetyl/propionyl/methylcrotonyl-CoA carboxylase subunit alpha n=1 Tax=Halopseudomonas pelagia TaxID=553151 RepID=UPI0003A5D488|nr:acetyl/propionyl/methylcrotonyl-CoA carboxylase subunit alpha [Halopseudomonas pelagia]